MVQYYEAPYKEIKGTLHSGLKTMVFRMLSVLKLRATKSSGVNGATRAKNAYKKYL